MPTASRDVRSQGQSGKHVLALSFSGFDPERTFGLVVKFDILIRAKRVARNARRNARFGVALETRAMSLDVPQRRTVQLHLPGGDIAELPIEQMHARHQKNK